MKAYEKFEKRLDELGLLEDWYDQGGCGRVAKALDDKVVVFVHEGDDAYTEFTYPPIWEMSQDENFRRKALQEYNYGGDEKFVRELINWYLHPNRKCPLFPVDVYLVWDNPTWVDFEDDKEPKSIAEYIFSKTTEEYCDNCEETVELSQELRVQRCPKCGKWLVPCSACPLEECSSRCPLERMAQLLNNE